MKLIKLVDVEKQERNDGRTVRRLLKENMGIEINEVQILYVTHPPGLIEALHSHQKSFEILYFLDKAKYKINNKDYEIDEGDLVVFEPQDIHGAIAVPHQVRLLVIQAPAITDDKNYEENAVS